MKKVSAIFLSLILISMLFASVSLAASVTLNVNVNESTGEVNVAGNISTGAGQGVTILVKSPSGNVDYINQTTSGEGGAYQFNYITSGDPAGDYIVMVGGNEVEVLATKTFQFAGVDPTDPTDPTDPDLEVTVTANVSVNESTGEVTISGVISSGAGKEVTVLVKSPSGKVDYIDQMTSGIDGTYQFKYVTSGDSSGEYIVTVGGSGVAVTETKTFTFAGVKPTDPDPTTPTKPNPSVPSSNADSITSHNTGATVTPSSANLVKTARADGKVITKLTLASDTVDRALGMISDSEKQLVAINLTKEASVHVEVTGDDLTKALTTNQHITISIQTLHGSYDIPLHVLQDEVAIGVKIHFVVEQVEDALNDEIAEQFGNGAIVDALHFKILLEKDGQITEIDDFGHLYVDRTLNLPKRVNPHVATGVMYDPNTKQLTFAPTVFNSQGDRATIKRNGNSVYTVIEQHKTFQDIDQSWAKNDIEMLASKLIVFGKSDAIFAPEEEITRAQFAALLVRALGLTSVNETNKFSDVEAGKWYEADVNTASHYKLVSGYADGTFKPNKTISREEMAVMIANSIAFINNGDREVSNQLVQFSDRDEISSWAKNAAAIVVDAGIINGVTPDTFVPQKYATRAEATTMLKRLLQHLNFIN